jgi:hypothetical protein
VSEIELMDAILRTALELQRVSAFEEAEAEAILRELERELRALLNSRTLNAASKREIAALIKQAEAAIDARYATVATSVDTKGLVMLVSERTVEALKIIAPDVARVTAQTLASLADDVLIDGAPSSAWWARQSEDTAFKFAAQVRQGVINGETNERIVARIVGRATEPGIMDVARRNARALVHSSVMSAANDARLATFRANARLFKGVRWLSTLDSKSCVVCAALDRQSWDLEGAKLPGTTLDFEAPPKHWSCRCTLTGIPRSEPASGPKIGARASSEGPVAVDTTFDAFLKRQSPAFIERVLGKRRADLYRAGKITLRDLVSGTGRELTLDELRAA